MTVTGASNWRDQTLTESQFVQRARDRWPAYVLADNDPAWAYGRCVHHRVDANLVLEIFDHESSSGRAGTALETHSAGNTREPTFGDVPKVAATPGEYGKPDIQYYESQFGQVAGRSGQFARFRNWRDGWESTVARLSAEEWAYAKLRTIAEVIETWAPRADMNDPNRYTEAVVAGMNRNMQLEGGDDVPATTYPKPQMIWYPSPNKDRYDASDGMTTPRTIEAVCLHVGTSTKASNLGWLTNPASQASCNAYVDKQGQIYEMVPMASAAWTAGRVNNPDMSNPLIKRWVDNGWNPNTRLYNIETEGNPSDDLTEPQLQSITEIIAWVSDANQFPVSRVHVIGHYQIDSVDRSHCPSFTDTEWTRIVAGARNLRDTFDPDTPDIPRVPTLPPTVEPTVPEPHGKENPYVKAWGIDPFWIPVAIQDRIDEDDWEATGWCVSEAFSHKGQVWQFFERRRYEINGDGSITLGLVGVESMFAQFPERRR